MDKFLEYFSKILGFILTVLGVSWLALLLTPGSEGSIRLEVLIQQISWGLIRIIIGLLLSYYGFKKKQANIIKIGSNNDANTINPSVSTITKKPTAKNILVYIGLVLVVACLLLYAFLCLLALTFVDS